MQMMTVETVNQCVLWVSLLIQLIENVNQDAYHCFNTILDVFCDVRVDIMQIQQVIVFYQLNVTPVYLMVKMEPQNVLLLAQVDLLLILILIIVLQSVLMVGLVILILVDKLV